MIVKVFIHIHIPRNRNMMLRLSLFKYFIWRFSSDQLIVRLPTNFFEGIFTRELVNIDCVTNVQELVNVCLVFITTLLNFQIRNFKNLSVVRVLQVIILKIYTTKGFKRYAHIFLIINLNFIIYLWRSASLKHQRVVY